MIASEMPFRLGNTVIERIGEHPNHRDRDSKVVEVTVTFGDVRTDTGHWYTKFGQRIPLSDSYRSLRSEGYRHAPKEPPC